MILVTHDLDVAFAVALAVDGMAGIPAPVILFDVGDDEQVPPAVVANGQTRGLRLVALVKKVAWLTIGVFFAVDQDTD